MKLLLTGARGQLGQELAHQLAAVGHLSAFSRAALDVTDHNAVSDAIHRLQPDIIVNAAAYTAVDKAENEPEQAYAINADAVAYLAQCAATTAAWLIHYSTDYVFDGAKPTPYVEGDGANPINVYGASKLAGEQAIAESGCQHVIFRTTWVIGKAGNNFARTMLRLAGERQCLKVIRDQQGVPTSPALIAKVTIDAIKAIHHQTAWPTGCYHLVPHGVSNWHEIAQTLIGFAAERGLPLQASVADIHAISTADYPTTAQRPLNSRLDTQKLRARLSFDLPHWRDDLLAVASEMTEALYTR